MTIREAHITNLPGRTHLRTRNEYVRYDGDLYDALMERLGAADTATDAQRVQDYCETEVRERGDGYSTPEYNAHVMTEHEAGMRVATLLHAGRL